MDTNFGWAYSQYVNSIAVFDPTTNITTEAAQW
jgi:hypothetical protein